MTVKRAGKLDTAPTRLANGLRRGLILSGDLVAQRAQRKARVKTGRMKRNIQRGNPTITGYSGVIEIGSGLIYFPVHEFGSGDKSENPGKSKNPTRRGIKAQPMVRPALRESKEDIKRILIKSVIGALKGTS